ncbi:unnamed protein product [Aspergillus oryzae]|nr:unnamed protein product [Aspergillus oryzae]GMF93180.1 unnamed protein product [Aspergillus oryzae]GMG03577.1 unnamed protein product [Aspergillus oryzae]
MDPTWLGLPPSRILCSAERRGKSTMDNRDDTICYRHESASSGELFPTIKAITHGSVAATLKFAAAQRDSRIQGRPNWRELELDGSKEPITQTVHVTLSMSTEVKRNLPRKGVRWLYLRSEVKRIVDGRMDMEILLCDETMELIAVSQHAAHIIPSAQKLEKGGGKANI